LPSAFHVVRARHAEGQRAHAGGTRRPPGPGGEHPALATCGPVGRRFHGKTSTPRHGGPSERPPLESGGGLGLGPRAAVSANLLDGLGHVKRPNAATRGVAGRVAPVEALPSGASVAGAPSYGRAPASTTPTACWGRGRMVGAHGSRRLCSGAGADQTHTERPPPRAPPAPSALHRHTPRPPPGGPPSLARPRG
jgi:hypothetical protein